MIRQDITDDRKTVHTVFRKAASSTRKSSDPAGTAAESTTGSRCRSLSRQATAWHMPAPRTRWRGGVSPFSQRIQATPGAKEDLYAHLANALANAILYHAGMQHASLNCASH